MTPGTLVDGGVELHVDLLVAGRPALLAALFFSHPYMCLGFIQNRPPASFSEFSPILRTSPWVTCSFHAIVKDHRLVVILVVVHG